MRTEREQLTEFSEVVKEIVPSGIQVHDGESYDTRISEFLERPRLITRVVWTTANGFNTDIFAIPILPTLQTLTEVMNKLKGFAQLQCRLHVRVNINGSVYHGGRVLMSWAQCGGESENGVGYSPLSNIGIQTVSQKSTLPGVWINPCAEKAYELSIPFIHCQGYYDLTDISPSAYDNLRLTVVNPLKWYGAAGVDSSVSLTVYAWMSEVVLCTPVPQSEVGGAVMRVVESAPKMVRGFASAFARSATSAALTAAGLGSPTVMGPVIPTVSTTVPRIKADGPFYCESLSSHRLVETPITPLEPSADPMSFRNIAGREAFLSRISWTDNTSPTGLAFYPVYPGLKSDVGLTSGVATGGFQVLPMGFVAAPFRYWRGSIKFRVEVIAPKLVRGMLRLKFLPRMYGTPAFAAETGDVLTKYIDVSESTEVEMVIPFCASTRWLKNKYYYDSPDKTNMNGTFVIDIVEPLKSSGVGVEVNVFASCADLEVATLDVNDLSLTILGSNVFAIPQAPEVQLDVFQNIRDVAKVPRKVRVYQEPTVDTSKAAYSVTFRAEPLYGENPQPTAVYGQFTTPMAWFSSAFIASRGSIRHTIMPTKPMTKIIVKSARLIFGEGLESSGFVDDSAFETDLRSQAGSQHVLKDTFGDPTFSFENPVQLPCVFRYARWDTSNTSVFRDAAWVKVYFDCHEGVADPANNYLVLYQSAGDDYSLDFFQFVPIAF